ncbi:MAG: phosphoenolpyruvate carboxylase [Candidatus Micrarchaeota archaeon]|nr:phosphoenolpyruvate carboxylase [Candidatus Micrarchaeota archaeon]
MTLRVNVPKTMSTQHPDNVNIPFFANYHDMAAEDEIQEAYYVFSHMGIEEQMWDYEGKEVDNQVVKKLFTRYGDYFKETILGEDKFLTLRVPNPVVEKNEAKLLIETLESIPRFYDVAKLFYNRDVTPVFEVILPMTSDVKSLNAIFYYYKDFVVGKKTKLIDKTGMKVIDWIGDFNPEQINVIPLFETKEQILNCDRIVKGFLENKELEYQRVFLARSDPALNYGNLSAVLMNKIGMYKLWLLQKETKIKIYPIIGVGSAPFRGNMRPETVDQLMKGYPFTHTFTLQSSFKYDNDVNSVVDSVKKLNHKQTQSPKIIDDDVYYEIIEKYSEEYAKQVGQIANVVNLISKYIPKRRRRKLHIGLFGYSRETGKVKLPRAITFAAAMYSIGYPPELLAINVIDDTYLHEVRKVYSNFDYDLKCALKFFNPHSPFVHREVKKKIEDLVDYEIDKKHKEITDKIIIAIKNYSFENLTELITSAAALRRFLG